MHTFLLNTESRNFYQCQMISFNSSITRSPEFVLSWLCAAFAPALLSALWQAEAVYQPGIESGMLVNEALQMLFHLCTHKVLLNGYIC